VVIEGIPSVADQPRQQPAASARAAGISEYRAHGIRRGNYDRTTRQRDGGDVEKISEIDGSRRQRPMALGHSTSCAEEAPGRGRRHGIIGSRKKIDAGRLVASVDFNTFRWPLRRRSCDAQPGQARACRTKSCAADLIERPNTLNLLVPTRDAHAEMDEIVQAH